MFFYRKVKKRGCCQSHCFMERNQDKLSIRTEVDMNENLREMFNPPYDALNAVNAGFGIISKIMIKNMHGNILFPIKHKLFSIL